MRRTRGILWAELALIAVLFSQNGYGAARSVKVIIKNDTSHDLIYVSGSVKHGIVTTKPPSLIHPSEIGVLFAESKGVATGTEGHVTYRLQGVNGTATFHWDNPFDGKNSADGSAPPGFAVEQIGDTGNRTLLFFSIHDANQPAARCNPVWIIGALGKQAENRLDGFDRGIGFLSTPFKRMGISGWVDTGCDAIAEGWPVRDAQHSTDNFWTIDVRLKKFRIMGRNLPVGQQLYVRIEVEPGTAAHASAAARAEQLINFHGRILIDTHHGDELVEVHPADPIRLGPDPTFSAEEICKTGFVWREAIPDDHVCVTVPRRDQVRADNARSREHTLPHTGVFDPHTCRSGFMWRLATPADHVCAPRQSRIDAEDDNRHAGERRMH